MWDSELGEFGGSRAARADGTGVCMGMGPSGRAAGKQAARLGGSRHGLGNGGRCEAGEPAEKALAATARNGRL
jgi:hypothetical protein